MTLGVLLMLLLPIRMMIMAVGEAECAYCEFNFYISISNDKQFEAEHKKSQTRVRKC